MRLRVAEWAVVAKRSLIELQSPKTNRVFASLFSMGVPVKPMNEAFGSGNRAGAQAAADAEAHVVSGHDFKAKVEVLPAVLRE